MRKTSTLKPDRWTPHEKHQHWREYVDKECLYLSQTTDVLLKRQPTKVVREHYQHSNNQNEYLGVSKDLSKLLVMNDNF